MIIIIMMIIISTFTISITSIIYYVSLIMTNVNSIINYD